MYTLKKSLGQHFLRDETVINRIIAALGELPVTRLLETGPGGGALTKRLLQLPGIEFKAVEIDEEKVTYLQQAYPSLADKLIHKSVLDIDCPFDAPFTLIGNFPYNISTQILFKVLDWKEQVEYMIGMFQKEVAERVVAPEGSKTYGVTSVLVQAYYDAVYLFDVPPGSFAPPPKVMSGVIRLSRKATPVAIKSDKALRMLVKAAFNQRRKQLRNAVRGLFTPGILQDDIFNKRAEALSVADFAALTFQMNG